MRLARRSAAPRRAPGPRRLFLIGAAIAMAASACSGGALASDGAGDKPLPGIKEFGLNEEQYAAHIEKVQALIATCMRNAGFEYIPVDVQTIELAQASVRSEPGMTREEYKKLWGLSVTTRFDDPVQTIGQGSQNMAIFESLSEADQVAYNRTLFGENLDSSFAFTFDEEDFSSTGGCTRKAVEATFTPEQVKGTYVNPKDVLVSSDPRVQEANRNWSICMREYGYNYVDDQDEIIQEYEDRLDALLEGDDPADLTGDRLEALHALQKEEIAASLADLDCQIRYTDDVIREVEIEVFGQPVSG